MQPRSTVVAALAAVLAVALAACSGGDDPAASPSSGGGSSSSTSTTSTASTTVTSPSSSTTAKVSIPPEAQKHTEAGAKAFSGYYIEVADDALLNADSSALRAISAAGCRGCKVFIDWADDLRSKDQHLAKNSFALKGQMVLPNSTSGTFVIDNLVQESAADVVDASGRVVSKEPAQKVTLRNTVKWSSGRWVIDQSALVK